MRNTRLYIIISVVVLIIVGIIASILSNQLKKGNETPNNDQSTDKIETSGTKTLSKTEKIREASRITKQSNASLLTDDQVKRLNKLSADVNSGQDNVITGEDFDIGFSNITNLFCVQKKTPQADVEFTKYLTEKNALDIYEKDPSLFAITDVNCSEYLKKQEEYIVQDLELDEETFPDSEMSESAIPNTGSKRSTDYDEIKNTFSEIIQSIYDLGNIAVPEDNSDLSTNSQTQINNNLSQEENSKLVEFNKQLPWVTNDVELGYSLVTNKYYIYRKTDKADEALTKLFNEYEQKTASQ